MILVTGGTGFVGQEVVRKLVQLHYRVRLLVRNPDRAAHLARLSGVEVVRGDALKPETLPAALRDVQAVIHLIGIIAETPHVTFAQAHLEATRNVLQAAQMAGVTRWIQMSACGTRPNASSLYHLTKWQAEELVRYSKLDWTILRPSLIYGHDEQDRILNVLSLALQWPVLYSFPLLDGGRARIQPVSVREVAHCFALAITRPAALGKTYDLVGPVPFTWRALAETIAASLGRRTLYEAFPLLVTLRALLWLVALLFPAWVVYSLSEGALTWVEAELGMLSWALYATLLWNWNRVILFNVPGAPIRLLFRLLHRLLPRRLQASEQLKMAAEDNVGDPRPAATDFSYEPEPFDVGLQRVLRDGWLKRS